ncbi:MAG: TIGR02757 family protein [Flavobacteriia bacterium]|nr:TIGR02757 family protein [Flavobacteriia bacterium]
MTNENIKDFLDFKVNQYYKKVFIEQDPLQIPHQYTLLQDIEISAFLTSILSWGNRKQIIKSAQKLMNSMGQSPYDFVKNYSPKWKIEFTYRTFNSTDLDFFIRSLQHIYSKGNSLEWAFQKCSPNENCFDRIAHFRRQFLSIPHLIRSEKHLSNPEKNSACKRLYMYLRWMVRESKMGIDFGLWKTISPSELAIPLDVHTGNTARALGLITRKQNDRQALEELMKQLIQMNPTDPTIYDFALFGLGIFEKYGSI